MLFLSTSVKTVTVSAKRYAKCRVMTFNRLLAFLSKSIVLCSEAIIFKCVPINEIMTYKFISVMKGMTTSGCICLAVFLILLKRVSVLYSLLNKGILSYFFLSFG